MKAQRVNLQPKQSLRIDQDSTSSSLFKNDEDRAQLDKNKCPNAPTLKPRNQCFKFNSAKNFLLMENLTQYTPFFYSEGEESSDGDNEESTQDFMNNIEDLCMGEN